MPGSWVRVPPLLLASQSLPGGWLDLLMDKASPEILASPPALTVPGPVRAFEIRGGGDVDDECACRHARTRGSKAVAYKHMQIGIARLRGAARLFLVIG